MTQEDVKRMSQLVAEEAGSAISPATSEGSDIKGHGEGWAKTIDSFDGPFKEGSEGTTKTNKGSLCFRAVMESIYRSLFPCGSKYFTYHYYFYPDRPRLIWIPSPLHFFGRWTFNVNNDNTPRN